ncbi:hypothetical protein [Natranaerofaba carboxydovora]|uniref:hypothetical protein n=1 Tax=Natranaerofaba carboxydovora TaxID=2742683 RepID=UPI001F14676C|nr:hypothetical protein [Natranaerofaba carboxydovora]UMZ73004.1 Serine/threonine-protein kinase CtkA [Natranaerofaba carboxydovora]
MTEYYLMLFDTPVVKFKVIRECVFKQPRFENIAILRQNLVPHDLKDNNIQDWLEYRKAPENRENIRKVFHACGIKDVTDYIEVSKGLTLKDSYWIKPVGSNFIYDDINLYENNFNESIAELAFKGYLEGDPPKSTSPEFSTDGALAKCWHRKNGRIYLYKKGTSGAKNAGNEPYSEFYACQVLEAMGIKDYVKYDLRKFKGELVSECEIFTDKEIGYISAAEYGLNLYPGDLLKAYEKIGQSDFFRQMIIFDGIVLNRDRHLGNFGFLIDNATNKVIKNAPIFDNGYSLLPFMSDDKYHQVEKYLNRIPRIGDDFINIAKKMLTEKEKPMIKRLKGFKFKKHPKYNLPDKRLEVLEEVVRGQASKILKL